MVDVFATVEGSAVTISNNTLTKLTGLSLVDVHPTGSPSPFHNTNQRFEIAAGWDGWYLLNARGQWGATFSESCLLQARINNTTTVGLSQYGGSPDTSGAVQSGTAFIKLNEGDYVDVRVRQTSGSSKQFTLAECTLIWMHA